jgi:hypothetical protein
MLGADLCCFVGGFSVQGVFGHNLLVGLQRLDLHLGQIGYTFTPDLRVFQVIHLICSLSEEKARFLD